MNRTVIIAAIVLALGVGGYYLYQANVEQAAAEAAAEAAAVEAAEAAAAQAAAAAEAAAAEAAAAEATAAEAADTEGGSTEVPEEGTPIEAAPDEAVADETTGEASLATIFSSEGFDVDRAIAALETADIAPETRTALTIGLQTARDNPALLEVVLIQARAALGISQ